MSADNIWGKYLRLSDGGMVYAKQQKIITDVVDPVTGEATSCDTADFLNRFVPEHLLPVHLRDRVARALSYESWHYQQEHRRLTQKQTNGGGYEH